MCYGWGATSEYWLEISVFEGGWSVSAKLSRSRKHPSRTIFARIDRPVNALQLCRWQYSHKQTSKQTFFKWSLILDGNPRFAFSSIPLGEGLGERTTMLILNSLEST